MSRSPKKASIVMIQPGESRAHRPDRAKSGRRQMVSVTREELALFLVSKIKSGLRPRQSRYHKGLALVGDLGAEYIVYSHPR